ncbi:HRDC domain-containing protein [Rhodospirillum sp. A1_3_36]|uniref:HRDC domain-containing protein n=1 Tax=Rhodospirillum sp. A1_3_36 TaxID=3391666 RepID=UPI0039A438E0
MRIDLFTIPAHGGEDGLDDLNALLSSARIVTVDRHFVSDGAASFWAVCVVSQPGGKHRPFAKPGKKPSIDYREVLDAEDFALYARLRDLRKTLAEREGVPVYAVMTNEQMAEMARHPIAPVLAEA